MVVVRFSVFEDKIRSGEKKQTIRPFENYRHLKIGNKVHCYSTERREGIRRPVLKELLHVGRCTEVLFQVPWRLIRDNEYLARLDGFKDAREMRAWFEARYPDLHDAKRFRIIRWD